MFAAVNIVIMMMMMMTTTTTTTTTMMMMMQVIVLALVMSFIIKRDSEVIDYEDAFGKMNTVDDINLKGLMRVDVNSLQIPELSVNLSINEN